MTGPGIDRRAFVRGALLGAVGIGGMSALAGCDTVTRSTDIVAINKRVQLPNYVRYEGPTPDLPTISDIIPDAFYRYPSAVQALKGAPGDGSRVTGSVPTSSPIPPTLGRNQYWQELNKRLDLDLQLNITPAGDFPNRFQTSLAGDTLGDMWNIFNPPYLPQLLEAKAQDLTQYLSGDAVERYPFLANLPTESWRGCVFSGGIYALPISRGIVGTTALIARQDLFDERGVGTDFRNVDELMAIATEMTDERANRWAFAGVPIKPLSWMLGLPNVWQEAGGTLTNENELEEHKEMLDVGARMISAGLVHPDSIAAYDGKVWFNQGSAVLIEDTYTAVPGFYLQNVNGDAFELGFPTVPGPDGSPAEVWLNNPNNSLAAVAKGSEERIRMFLEVLNWMAAPFGTEEYTFRKYGIEGHDFDFRNGEPVLTEVGNSETALGAFPIQYVIDSPIPIYYAGHPEGTDAVYQSLKTIEPKVVSDPTYGLYSPTASTKGAILQTLLDRAKNDILLGRKPVSEWDSVMDEWRVRGGNAVRDEFEKAMAARE